MQQPTLITECFPLFFTSLSNFLTEDQILTVCLPAFFIKFDARKWFPSKRHFFSQLLLDMHGERKRVFLRLIFWLKNEFIGSSDGMVKASESSVFSLKKIQTLCSFSWWRVCLWIVSGFLYRVFRGNCNNSQ